MNEAFICDAVRTPIGRYGGALSSIRTDDLASIPIRSLLERNPGMNPTSIEDVILGCANQAGEDNRNVARMALLLSGIPETVPGNPQPALRFRNGCRVLCLESHQIRRTISLDRRWCGKYEPGPVCDRKSHLCFFQTKQYGRHHHRLAIHQSKMEELFGTDSMPETAENLAEQFNISREDQDSFALSSQQKTSKAMASGRLAIEMIPVSIPRRKQEPLQVEQDEHPRGDTTLEKLSKLPAPSVLEVL